MGDFLKLFRRQRSMKQVIDETSDNQRNETSASDAEENENTEASVERHMSVCSEYGPGSFAMSSHKPSHGFKEPKGWRKSLRKLKLKKPEQTISVSSDNILKMPSGSYIFIPKNIDKSSTETAGKRWSYSQDLSEDNVPGARELRGSIERKLSVKKEVDENEHVKKYRKKSFKHKKNGKFFNDNSEYQHYVESLNSSACPQYEHPVDNRLDNSNLSTFQFEEKSMCSHLERSHSTPNATEHVQDPFQKHDWSAFGSEEWTSSENRDSYHLTVDNDTAYTSKLGFTIVFYSQYYGKACYE